MAQSKSATALRAVLEGHVSSEIESFTRTEGKEKQNVIELDSGMSLVDAKHALWDNNILGAPVWNEATKSYIGFFDMRDILSAVIEASRNFHKSEAAASTAGDRSAMKKRYSTVVERAVAEMNPDKNTSSGATPSISYLAARNSFVSCPPTATLFDLAKVMSQRHCHRVPIVNGSAAGKCINIISQSAVVKFLSTHVAIKQLNETLSEAGLAYKKEVISVRDDMPAADAFDVLDSHRLSGIAVVDEDGVLVGNTSARDIKIAAMDTGKTSLDTDILSYLASVRQATFVRNERYPSCHVHEGDAVSHVVNLLAKTGYHRVFVVDNDVKPVGVISVADVLRFAIGE